MRWFKLGECCWLLAEHVALNSKSLVVMMFSGSPKVIESKICYYLRSKNCSHWHASSFPNVCIFGEYKHVQESFSSINVFPIFMSATLILNFNIFWWSDYYWSGLIFNHTFHLFTRLKVMCSWPFDFQNATWRTCAMILNGTKSTHVNRLVLNFPTIFLVMSSPYNFAFYSNFDA